MAEYETRLQQVKMDTMQIEDGAISIHAAHMMCDHYSVAITIYRLDSSSAQGRDWIVTAFSVWLGSLGVADLHAKAVSLKQYVPVLLDSEGASMINADLSREDRTNGVASHLLK